MTRRDENLEKVFHREGEQFSQNEPLVMELKKSNGSKPGLTHLLLSELRRRNKLGLEALFHHFRCPAHRLAGSSTLFSKHAQTPL